MDIIEPIKRLAENVTGVGIPSRDEALACVRECRPLQLKFRDDGYIPNNPNFPLLHFGQAIRFGRKYDRAAVLEKIFNAHGWGDAWRNGIYAFVHYHPMIHEVLAVAHGSAALRLGGNKGRTVKVSAGDVIVVPAGVGHECLRATREFLVVGAYPPTGTYSECRGSFQERDQAIKRIHRIGVPKQHPLFGRNRTLW